MSQTQFPKPLSKRSFDGGQAQYKGWDQYVEKCQAGAVHLHLYRLGRYIGCSGCTYQESCLKEAHVSGEQAEG